MSGGVPMLCHSEPAGRSISAPQEQGSPEPRCFPRSVLRRCNRVILTKEESRPQAAFIRRNEILRLRAQNDTLD